MNIFLVGLLIASGLSADHITVGITSPYNFCLMVPPYAGGNVGNTEGSSVSKCIGTVPGSDSAGPLPSGKSILSILYL